MTFKNKLFGAILFIFLVTTFFSFRYFLFPNTVSDINHIVHLGQSLAAGEQSLPIVTKFPTGFKNLRFKIGTHTWTRLQLEGEPEKRDSAMFEFTHLTAVERGHEGETIGNGLCDHLSQTSAQYIDTSEHFLFSYTGQGGRMLRELDKRHDDAKDVRSGVRRSGGGYYQTAIDDVRRAKHQATKLKKTYSVFALTWMQGESNSSLHLNRWDKPVASREEFIGIYAGDLIQIKNDLQEDIKKITDQKAPPPFFTYQTASFDVAAAQLKACDSVKDMYMVGPTYMLPNAENSRLWGTAEHGDPIHLTADGERWLGENFAKVIRRVAFEDCDWEPLRPGRAWFSNDRKSVMVRFIVPQPPLVLDTVLLPRQGRSFGFQIYTRNAELNIQDVFLIDDKTIKISLLNPVDRGLSCFLRYGKNSVTRKIGVPIMGINEIDSVTGGQQYIELEFNGDHTIEFSKLAEEGVFKIVNEVFDAADLTSLLIRRVYLNENGNTVLVGEREDLRNGVAFKPGQFCFGSRLYPFGNLRDSDDEPSTFTFADSTYGTRYGKPYPLNNWLIIFEDLLVE